MRKGYEIKEDRSRFAGPSEAGRWSPNPISVSLALLLQPCTLGTAYREWSMIEKSAIEVP